ncbi:ras association domain-containing protein 10-like [Corythoichthys intestinalis]|uniref:ras association domain-containing protein 10-like n=1 Tax=Corythoichthys intestinalis TaxID=161448 RepID=UPI0025A65613|nr:ras association domain-containing protein 10-like [Corythoichthys intestinalis]XP_061813364.1 ras association domain-containing protein 10 [Nerophis lumbriciformis]
MESEEGKVSVWVCQEEKLVSGLTKKTTCSDVVQVLLEDQNLRQGASAGMLSGPAQSYCVVEKWRGFERILPNKTKILRLWSAWGDEQENVRFVLVKSDASLPNNGPRSAEARVVQRRENWGPDGVIRATARICWPAGATNMSQERQRRIVRKAFRKLDKMNKKKEQAPGKDKSSLEKMETLVHLVLSQDHTIRQQVQRLKELDKEIERYESKVHYERVKTHGVNYVQDTYLDDSSSPETFPRKVTPEALAQFEEYARMCEEVVRLQEELMEREALVESITGEIQEELNHRWMKRRQVETGGEEEKVSEICRSAPLECVSGQEAMLEEERIKTQLNTSLYIGLRLKTDLDGIRGDLDMSLALWESKETELMDLLAKVETMEIEQLNTKLECEDNDDEDDEAKGDNGAVVSEKKSSIWVEHARGLSKTCIINDEDSDTGLSSMHSQDSDNPPVCESLV